MHLFKFRIDGAVFFSEIFSCEKCDQFNPIALGCESVALVGLTPKRCQSEIF